MKRRLLLTVLFSFCLSLIITDMTPDRSRAAIEGVPPSGEPLSLSPAFQPPLLKGVRLSADDPFRFEFFIDAARPVDAEQTQRLVDYFLAALTMPEDDLWVNLSPDEPDRILCRGFEKTRAGRDMLAADYVLKQLASSLTHPDTPTGEAYWRVENGKSTIENRLGKIWIVPDKAEVLESGTTAVIAGASLQLQCEDDAQQVLLSAITKDVNEGANFATLRQIYHSLILATWFKQKFAEGVFQGYVDQRKIAGIDTVSQRSKRNLYALYLESFRRGVYDLIGTAPDGKRRYFSGGIRWRIGETLSVTAASSLTARTGKMQRHSFVLRPVPGLWRSLGSVALTAVVLACCNRAGDDSATTGRFFNADSSRQVTRSRLDSAVGELSTFLAEHYSDTSSFFVGSDVSLDVVRAHLQDALRRLTIALDSDPAGQRTALDEIWWTCRLIKGFVDRSRVLIEAGESFFNDVAGYDFINTVKASAQLTDVQRDRILAYTRSCVRDIWFIDTVMKGLPQLRTVVSPSHVAAWLHLKDSRYLILPVDGDERDLRIVDTAREFRTQQGEMWYVIPEAEKDNVRPYKELIALRDSAVPAGDTTFYADMNDHERMTMNYSRCRFSDDIAAPALRIIAGACMEMHDWQRAHEFYRRLSGIALTADERQGYLERMKKAERNMASAGSDNESSALAADPMGGIDMRGLAVAGERAGARFDIRGLAVLYADGLIAEPDGLARHSNP